MAKGSEKAGGRVHPLGRRPEIKIVDFKKVGQIQKEFRGCVGLCDFEKRTIYLDLSSPLKPQPSLKFVLQHELAHLKLDDLGIKLPAKVKERFCDLVAVMEAPKKALTGPEQMLREVLLSLTGNRWSDVLRLAYGRGPASEPEKHVWANHSRLLCGE